MEERIEYIKKLFKAEKMVIKIGSAVITKDDEGLNKQVLSQIAYEVQRLQKAGKKIVLVSSGAIACGRAKLKFYNNPISLSEKQALAACGQADLIHAYEEIFDQYNLKVAQVLLTAEDLSVRKRYLNAIKTLNTLLKWGIVPIINENDTVATEEIRFSDNDLLSALVALALPADVLFILSEIDALYKEDPRNNPSAEKVNFVKEVTPEIISMAGNKPGRLGRGGMYSKLLAAKMVTSSGIPLAILPGKEPLILERFFAGELVGTFFAPKERKLSMRKLWIKYYLQPEGKLFLDEGAVEVLKHKGKSLLIAGVKGLEGHFSRGASVVCYDPANNPIAKGIVNFSSEEILNFLREAKKPDKEIIHRDNLVLLD
ncbi:MAG: glutamate 5-kinase [Caldimicrobium sp.]